MDELITWLRAQLDDDERVARATAAGRWFTPDILRINLAAGDGDAEHIARWDPARVLAEVEAKRRILDLHDRDHECSTYDAHGEIDHCTWVLRSDDGCSTLRLLAQTYAGRDGWREEWSATR